MLADVFTILRDLATYKGREYAGEQDRLSNFRRNGETMGMDMAQIWAVYYNKHHDAVMQFVKDIGQNADQVVRLECLEERAMDMMVYLSLFIAIIDERQGGEVAKKIHNMALSIKSRNS